MANPWDSDPIIGKSNAPILGPPPLPPTTLDQLRLDLEKRRTAVTEQNAAPVWQTLTPEQAKASKLDPNTIWQRSSRGELKAIPGQSPASPDQASMVQSMLNDYGIDLNDKNDHVTRLINGSTSGKLEHVGADIAGTFGIATTGMQDIGRLKVIQNDITLKLLGGKLGNQISDADREFIMARLGDIANPDVPAEARAAAWDEVKGRFRRITGVGKPPIAPKIPSAGPVRIKDNADFARLPSGAEFIGPDGVHRRKP